MADSRSQAASAVAGSDDVQRLRASILDLVALSALPAMLSGKEPAAIAEGVLGALVGLMKIDAAYLRLGRAGQAATVQAAHPGNAGPAAALGAWLTADEASVSRTAVTPDRARIARAFVGLNGEDGGIVIAARRDDFPTELERFLLQSAANQAAIALHNTRLLRDAREAQAHAREREEQIRLAVQVARLGTWQLDLTTGQLISSDSCKSNFGLTPDEELSYERLFQLIHADDRQRVRDTVTRAVEARTDYEAEYRTVWPDGSVHWIAARGRPAYDSAGQPLRMSGITLDVTERKQAEDTLRASEENYRFMLEALPQFMAITAEMGEVIWINRRWYDYTGIQEAEALGSGWLAAIHPDDLEMVKRRFAAARKSGLGYAVEYRFRRAADGAYRWQLGHVFKVRDPRGRPVWIGTAVDIHDRKVAEEALQAARLDAEAANRAKDEFLATLSHELRTPLTSILGWARMITTGVVDGAGMQRAFETIERNARLQIQLIDDILDVSRIITGRLRIDVRPVDLEAVLRNSIGIVTPAADAKRIRIETVIEPAARAVAGDAERLQQVVWNLLSNAVKFTPTGGRIDLRLARRPAAVEIQVSDTGRGIRREFLPHVFERFRQADSSTSRLQGGLGLGLAIVRHLVELHGGIVHAESAGEEQGATFTVRLPLLGPHRDVPEPAAVEPASRSVAAGAGALLTGLRVLVVEDETDARDLFVAVLEGHGGAVTAVDSAAEALRALDDGVHDVLVADIGLPGEDGHALLRRIRQRPGERGGRIRAVAVTAYARGEDRRRALEDGFDAHLAKPVEPSELVAVVSSLGRRAGR